MHIFFFQMGRKATGRKSRLGRTVKLRIAQRAMQRTIVGRFLEPIF